MTENALNELLNQIFVPRSLLLNEARKLAERALRYNTFVHLYARTGSTEICPDQPFNDVDYVAYVSDVDDASCTFCCDFDFHTTSPDGYAHDAKQGEFKTLRKNVVVGDDSCDINLILTNNLGFYTKFVEATAVARWLNLEHKQDRITLFRYILYGMLPDDDL